MKEVKISLDVVLELLDRAKFKLVDLDYLNKKPVPNPVPWVLATIRKTGGFEKPNGYISTTDKIIKDRGLIIKERQKRAARLKKQNEEVHLVEFNEALEGVYSTPDSDEYKAVIKGFSAFDRKRKVGSPTFRMAFEAGFKKIYFEGD